MSKPFKVGDRVRILSVLSSGKEIRGTGVIEEMDNNAVRIRPEKSYATGWVHIAQLRRLIKKPRREWWINSVTGEICSVSAFTIARGIADDGWVLVREVKVRK